jgi:hypothetical protein
MNCWRHPRQFPSRGMNPMKPKSTSPQNSTLPKIKKKKRKDSPKAQSIRFLQAAREAGCSEDEAVFDKNLKQIAKAKQPKEKPPLGQR